MRKILTLDDLHIIPGHHEKSFFQKFFFDLREALGGDEDQFSLESVGPIIILDSSDDLHDLRSAYLSESFFITIPEEVKEIRLGDQISYQVMVACNNDFMPIFFVPKELIDRYPEGKDYLARWI